jgi:hypothetical protein
MTSNMTDNKQKTEENPYHKRYGCDYYIHHYNTYRRQKPCPIGTMITYIIRDPKLDQFGLVLGNKYTVERFAMGYSNAEVCLTEVTKEVFNAMYFCFCKEDNPTVINKKQETLEEQCKVADNCYLQI